MAGNRWNSGHMGDARANAAVSPATRQDGGRTPTKCEPSGGENRARLGADGRRTVLQTRTNQLATVSMPPQSASDCTSVLTDSWKGSARTTDCFGNERVEDTVPFDGAAANAVGGSAAMPPAPSRSASVMDVIFLCMSRFFLEIPFVFSLSFAHQPDTILDGQDQFGCAHEHVAAGLVPAGTGVVFVGKPVGCPYRRA